MQRLDILLVERQLATSRTQAQRLIKTGCVTLSGQSEPILKPGLKVDALCKITVTPDPADQYVSRGALKLIGALDQFSLDPTGLIALDIGQSTGGFTDCLLQRGATQVVGIEVGHDQLAERLRQDPRVICYEGVNARALPQSLLEHTNGNGFDLAVMDVSFISQTKILPCLAPLLRSGGTLISLVKPQFEVGREGLGKGGLVKDPRLFDQVADTIQASCAALALKVTGYMESPITGGDGNQEFLLWAQKP